MTGRRRNDHPFRHCEARSAVAIHVPAPRSQWIASFLAMTGQGRMTGRGPNDRTGSSLFLKDDKYRNPHFLTTLVAHL